jgi:hypothetical protein
MSNFEQIMALCAILILLSCGIETWEHIAKLQQRITALEEKIK